MRLMVKNDLYIFLMTYTYVYGTYFEISTGNMKLMDGLCGCYVCDDGALEYGCIAVVGDTRANKFLQCLLCGARLLMLQLHIVGSCGNNFPFESFFVRRIFFCNTN